MLPTLRRRGQEWFFLLTFVWFKDSSPRFSVFWSNDRYADWHVREAMLAPWQVCLPRLLLGEFLVPASKWQKIKEPAQLGIPSLAAICSVQFEKKQLSIVNVCAVLFPLVSNHNLCT